MKIYDGEGRWYELLETEDDEIEIYDGTTFELAGSAPVRVEPGRRELKFRDVVWDQSISEGRRRSVRFCLLHRRVWIQSCGCATLRWFEDTTNEAPLSCLPGFVPSTRDDGAAVTT